MHDGCAQHKVLGELILYVRTEERLTLQREGGLILQFHVYVGSRLQDGLVQYRHRSHHVVYGVIDVFYQFGSTGRYRHRTPRHVHRTQANLRTVRTLVFTGHVELILLRHLLGDDERRVVQLLEAVLSHQPRVITQLLSQVTTERLQHGEDDATVRRIYRQSLNKIELTVRRGVILRIQTVQVHHAHQLLTLDRTLVQILHVGADRVVAVHDVQFELLTRHRGSTQRVDILHH